MNMHTIRNWYCGLLLLLSATAAGQQPAADAVLSHWRVCSEEVTSGKVRTYLFFDAASLEPCGEAWLPVWRTAFPRQADGTFRMQLSNVRWEPLTEREKSVLPLACIDTLTGHCRVQEAVTRKQPLAEVTVVPFRYHSGRYEKMVSFHLEGEPVARPVVRGFAQKRYAAHSVLSSGEVYKLALQKTGIYKLTYQQLEAMGVPMQALDIRSISIYGNGGSQLPESTDDAVPDDLEEVSVKVVDADGDGLFDPEDCLLFYAKGIVAWKMESATLFSHTFNIYSDYAYYFVKIRQAPTRTVTVIPSVSTPPTHRQDSYRYHELLEEDLISPTGIGRLWFKDAFDAITTRNYSFSLPELVSGSPVTVRLCMAAVSPSYASYFSCTADGGRMETFNFAASSGQVKTALYVFTPTASAFSLSLTYSKPSNTSKG
ncbi:MAG: hypothetical protein J6S82_02965, partial [Bacteroidales bacterium]|nr:hypothetical protein [Bacteroidales bacterium]